MSAPSMDAAGSGHFGHLRFPHATLRLGVLAPMSRPAAPSAAIRPYRTNDERVITPIASAPLMIDPTRMVTFEHMSLPGAVADFWRVRWQRDDGTHRGTTVCQRENAEAVFRAWTEGSPYGGWSEPDIVMC